MKNSIISTGLRQSFRVFANGPGDLDPIPGCVILKALKIVSDTSLLNTPGKGVKPSHYTSV